MRVDRGVDVSLGIYFSRLASSKGAEVDDDLAPAISHTGEPAVAAPTAQTRQTDSGSCRGVSLFGFLDFLGDNRTNRTRKDGKLSEREGEEEEEIESCA